MIKVLIVEDHPIVREGVTAVLERERDIDVVGSADTIGDLQQSQRRRYRAALFLERDRAERTSVQLGANRR